nr:hypothetical protein [Tanacetum cinerariifolium]
MTSITSLCELACQFVQNKLEEKQLEEEQAAKAQDWKPPVCWVDDDSFSLDNIDYVKASPPESELVSSEVMEIVIPEVGGIKASNDNPIPSYDPIISGTPLNLTPSGESEFFSEVDEFLAVEDEFTSSQFPKSDLDPEGDMLVFESFRNDDSSSDSLTNDDQSCSDEDVLENIVSKPLSEEEIIPMESLRTHDSSLPIASKIDSLLDERNLLIFYVIGVELSRNSILTVVTGINAR